MPKNASTKIADLLVKHDVDLLRVESTLRTRIRRMMKGLDQSIIERLHKIDPSAPSHINFKMKRLNTLMSITKDDIEKAYKAMKIETEKDLLGIAEAETIKTANTINRVIQVELASPILDRFTLRELVRGTLIQGAPSRDWWADQSLALRKRFERTMRESIFAGETIGDMVRRIRGTRVNGFADGIMKTSTRNAEALARTSAQAVAQNARYEMYKQNEDVVKGTQWQATLDGRTTTICQSLDGQAWDLNGDAVGTTSLPFTGPPPAHWNCRSTLIPLLKSWDELTSSKNRSLKKKLREAKPSKRTRASMDGQVSEDLKYSEWLKQKNAKNPAFVERILGPSKYRLWTQDKLAFTDMIDQSHRPLTVEQLKTKVEGSVFTRVKTQAERLALREKRVATRRAKRLSEGQTAAKTTTTRPAPKPPIVKGDYDEIALRNTARSEISAYKNSETIEHGYLYDAATGEKISSVSSGSGKYIDISSVRTTTNYQLRSSKMHLIHNHPNDTSLSFGDLLTARNERWQGISSVSLKSNTHYIAENFNRVIKTKELEKVMLSIEKSFDTHVRRTSAGTWGSMKSVADFEGHVINKMASQMGLFDYKVINPVKLTAKYDRLTDVGSKMYKQILNDTLRENPWLKDLI